MSGHGAAHSGLGTQHPGERIWGAKKCRDCGYRWATAYADAVGLIEDAPRRLRRLLQGRESEAMSKPDPKTWSPAGYVWHLADWFRIQGERIYARANDPGYRFVALGVEPDELGRIFKYDDLPVRTGLWTLERAADLLVSAARAADPTFLFRAEDGTEWTVHDLVVWVGHEAVHHELDIVKGLGLELGAARGESSAAGDRGSFSLDA